MKNTITIKLENQGQRLDIFLSEYLTDYTRSQIKKMILSGDVLVNNKEASVHKFLKEDDKINISLNSSKTVTKTTNKSKDNQKDNQDIFKDIKLISKTDDFLIIEKPVGLLVHPTDKNETNTLVDWLLSKYPNIKNVGEDPARPGIVHRLDKDVSGLMVIPLNQKSFEFFPLLLF